MFSHNTTRCIVLPPAEEENEDDIILIVILLYTFTLETISRYYQLPDVVRYVALYFSTNNKLSSAQSSLNTEDV